MKKKFSAKGTAVSCLLHLSPCSALLLKKRDEKVTLGNRKQREATDNATTRPACITDNTTVYGNHLKVQSSNPGTNQTLEEELEFHKRRLHQHCRRDDIIFDIRGGWYCSRLSHVHFVVVVVLIITTARL